MVIHIVKNNVRKSAQAHERSAMGECVGDIWGGAFQQPFKEGLVFSTQCLFSFFHPFIYFP